MLRPLPRFRKRGIHKAFTPLLVTRNSSRGIRALGLKSLVTLHGFAAEAELDDALRKADLAINLRYPTMGEASGSQLRIWAHALPSLVTNVGWYASLHADAVAFVRPSDDEIEDIQTHLRAFLEYPEKFALMGGKGFELLKQQHSPEGLANGLLSLRQRQRASRSNRPRLESQSELERSRRNDRRSPGLNVRRRSQQDWRRSRELAMNKRSGTDFSL